MVDAIASRGEFYTSYTPYQPEASQGNLQVFFEYQTLITRLTGMDVSNASLYDGGSAAAEAVLMALRRHRPRGHVVTAGQRASRISADAGHVSGRLDVELVTVGTPGGRDRAGRRWPPRSTSETACVLVQHPNFFGCLEEVERARRRSPTRPGPCSSWRSIRSAWACSSGRAITAPTSSWPRGSRSAARWHSADPIWASWPAASEFVRRMPGRIAGQTVDRRGQRCWVLTLQTREQHIRREKATSNICTNQGLFALRAADLSER